jgi:DNA mismatch repair protein MutL
LTNYTLACKIADMTIKLLDSQVISQIAAGEVVERPASVVKELVENSLDAGATQINIEVRQGGLNLIRITDNGRGIESTELELAFQRHATSKISHLEDLQSLTTLGFRGEALPSIAAVAEVQIVSSTMNAESGTQMTLSDGRVVKCESQARSPGITITVENIFRKIPARLKFLKSPSAEAGKIADVASQYALAYPEVRFNLVSDGKNILRSPGSGKLLDSVIAVYGLDTAQNMLEIGVRPDGFDNGTGSIIVTGLIGSPRIARASRDYLSFFVNRRWINSRSLSFAVEEAYHGLLMQGKHPVAVINIAIPSQAIDVNVHPAKTEIKFQDERAVFGAVQKTVRSSLVRTAPVPQVEEFKHNFNIPSVAISSFLPSAVVTRTDSLPSLPVTPLPATSTPLVSLPLLRVIGQLACNYIVAEGPDGLYLLDQHAAHERIMVEKIRRQWVERKIETQGLLETAAVELDPRQSAVMETHLPLLGEFGFDAQHFGERTFLVRAVPAVLAGRDWSAMLRETLDTQADNWSENLINRLACHSAVRAGQVLSHDEMRELVRQLEQTALPNSCPHGRPTMIRLTIAQLEKEFGRI